MMMVVRRWLRDWDWMASGTSRRATCPRVQGCLMMMRMMMAMMTMTMTMMATTTTMTTMVIPHPLSAQHLSPSRGDKSRRDDKAKLVIYKNRINEGVMYISC